MRIAVTLLVAAACLASVFYYGDLERAFGRRFIDGYHVHRRVEHSISSFDEPPVLVISTHAKHWYGTAAIWAVRVLYAALIFALPLLTWRLLLRSAAGA